jgi:non-ribosomal peptide synthetase component F
MVPLAPSYENAMHASGIKEPEISQSTCEMFSSVFGRRLSAGEVTPGYWKENMVSTVRFMDAVSELALNTHPDVFIEIGPHPALTGPVRDILASIRISDTIHLSSCTRGKPDIVAMFENVGEMISIGMPVKWAAVNSYFSSKSQTGRVLTDVPTYQWDHSSVNWGESRVSSAIQNRQFPRHELLGARAPNDTPLAPSWRNVLSTKDLHWLDGSDEKTPRALPTAIFTLMAIEAGRQLNLSEKLDANFISLKNLQILNPFTMPQDAVEMLFMTRKIDGESKWQFEIQSGPIKSSIGTWERHCVGEVTFSDHSTRPPNLQQYGSEVQDEEMLEYLKSLDTAQIPPVSNFKLTADLARGRFSEKIEGYENYPVHPLLLASLLDSSELIMLQSGPPAFYRIQSLDRIELPLGACAIEVGSFETFLSHRNPVSGRSRLDLESEDAFLTIDGIHLHIDGLVEKRLPLASTFFTSRTVPDITYMSKSTDMSIGYILELITHQWPMSDIGLVGLSNTDMCAIASALKGIKAQERSQFRTLDIVNQSIAVQLKSDRIRILDELDATRKYHLLVGTAKALVSDVNRLLSHGILCVQLEDPTDQDQFDNHLTEICKINGLSDSNWVLAKPHAPQNGTIVPRKLQVFAPTGLQMESLKDYVDFELILLDDRSALDGWKKSMSERSSEEKVDIVIYDAGERSILTTWHGSDLLPWIRLILGCANSVLWVSEQIEANPYQSVASSFIKTVKAEQPSIMISNLLFQGRQEPQFLASTTYDVLNEMIHGKNDVELIVKNGLIHSVRYFPDDALSASVGLLPPVIGDVSNADEYRLSVTGKESIALVHEKSALRGPPSCGKVRVQIESSIIDDTDVVAFSGGAEWNGLGHYFAGRVIACLDDNTSLQLGTRVVGFSSNADAHQRTIDVDLKYVHPLSGSLSSSEAAVRFAVYLTARVLVSAIARPTAADTIRIGVSGLLGAAIAETCRALSVTTSDQLDADFHVTFDPKKGLRLNDRPVKTIKYCGQDHLRQFAHEMLSKGSLSTTALSVFPIQDYKKAFTSAKLQPFGTVLSHSAAQRIPEALIYPASRGQLFRQDGAYVLIGGLGGLGQHISRWMIHNGARHIYALSRSAVVSSDAQRLISEMKDENASIQVIRADATDSIALQSALAQIRQSLPIKGCINLAMVLSDSAISTMTPEQWDSAVQVKIKSTWNLHTVTMQEDDLDFFVMFSSVASIFGNRTQSNYATGNAFLNSMSGYRHSLNLPATTIALGPVVGIGVLANKEELLRSFHVSGFAASDAKELDHIMTAIILESSSRERPVITVGFQMFETVDGVIQSAPEQTQLYWTEYPEFSALMDHKIGTGMTTHKSLLERLQEESNNDSGSEVVAHEMLQDAFFVCLQNLLGTQDARFDANMPLSKYGIDSLNAVAIRYWFFKEIGIDVPVFDILGSQNIEKLISRTLGKLYDVDSADKASNKKIAAPERLENLTIRPLSHSQRRLWFLHNFLPDQTTYNLLLVCHIAGTVDPSLFAQAWTILMSRHEVLRSKIVDTPDGLQQIPVEGAEFPLRVIDTTADGFADEVDRVSDLARSHVFNLEAGEVIRGWLVRSSSGTRFFLASHHLAWDRASSETVYSETTAIYKALLAGAPPQESLQPVSYQFVDYTVWQNNYLQDKEVVNPLINYWKEKLRDIPDCVSLLPMSLADKRPPTKLNQVGNLTTELDPELSAAIKAFCKHKGLTPFMFMASAIAALVNRLTGDDDVVINIPDGDRGHSAFDNLVGFTVNTLPIRSKFDGTMTYSKLLDDFRDSCLGAYEHRALPFDYLIQQLEVPRRTSHAAVSQITVNYQAQGSFQKVDYGAFQFVKYDHFNAKTQSDFVLEVEEQEVSGILKCTWEFDTAIYNADGISDLAEMYAVFINDVITRDGDVMLEDVQLVSSTDLKQLSSILQPSYQLEPSLVQLNSDLFPELFTSAVSKSPNDPAVCDDTGSYTYTELNMSTNAIANTLLRSGVSPGDSIAICSEQNKDCLVGIYGILRAGCSYVPIDPDFPLERIKTMLDDANVQRVLVEKVSSVQGQRILACGMRLSDMFEITSTVALASDADEGSPILTRPVNNLDPFCCIFTSGSTGRPKGIFLTHGQLRYEMEGYNKRIKLHRESRILMSSAIVFDMCLPAVYGAIQYGATVCIASREGTYYFFNLFVWPCMG